MAFLFIRGALWSNFCSRALFVGPVCSDGIFLILSGSARWSILCTTSPFAGTRTQYRLIQFAHLGLH